MLERCAVAIESLALGLWAGAMAAFAFIAAPVAFRTIASMTTFATFVGATLRAVGSFGAACGAIALACEIGRLRGEPRLRALRGAAVCVALAASAYESAVVLPRMEATAARIPGAIDSVPKDDPRREAYDDQHRNSTRVYGAAFLCVVAATALVALGRARTPRPNAG